MTTCGAIGALTVGGRVVGQVKCELDAGHDEERFAQGGASLAVMPHFAPATLHRMTLEWAPEAEPDLDLFDPGENFDVNVPFYAPVVEPFSLLDPRYDP